MKNIIPTTLMFAGLCPLLLPPCSAQETENEPLEAVTSVNPETHSILFESTRDRLTDLADDLGELKDKAGADAFAKNEATRLKGAMKNLLSYLVLRADKKGIAGITPCVKSVAVTDTHGSTELARLLWGWKRVNGILGQKSAIKQFSECFNGYVSCAEAPDELKKAIREIENKDLTGRNAGSRVEYIVRNVRGPYGLGCPPYTPDPEGFKAWMSALCGPLDGVEAEVRQLLVRIKAKGYYGSRSIEDAVLLMDKPVPPPEGLYKQDRQRNAAITSQVKELTSLLRGIKDMAGAEASAPRAMELAKAINAMETEYSSWLDSFYRCEPKLPLDEKSGDERDEATHKLMSAVGALRNLKQPYYGSPALQAVVDEIMGKTDPYAEPDVDYAADED